VLPYRPPPGELIRLLAPDDRLNLNTLGDELSDLFTQAQSLADELGLPMEVVDAEAVLEPRGFVFHLLRYAEADLRPWTSRLSPSASAYVHIHDLTNPEAFVGHVSDVPDLGGGCGSCGSGGGCGSCGEGCGDGHVGNVPHTGGGCGSGCSSGS